MIAKNFLSYTINYTSFPKKKKWGMGRCWVNSLLIDGLDLRGDSHGGKEK
ncbi:hypothetical protein EUTSA_v10026743mg [Eutrema salsugineum]|uniref:Uncharacterized protein n=1 Tax=Eutrema salsugineum TaxID=72664 RepID=V4MPD2_EUTSA|nr:hypothetical protein EUTSA_v10026743mg [Eutrema salsugineum]ESQ54888.1 hypothetical protein EUTSA_v10026743mg [Eutrema salsugineum]